MEENSIIKDKKDKMLMIVIGCLSVVLILLFIFFLVERSENKKHIAAIHEEKQLLEQELTDLSHNYDDLKTSNDTLNEKLQLEQEKILTLMDQMKKFRDNSYAEINRYKKEIGTLKNVLRSYVVQIDSLNQLNQNLETGNQKLAKENTEVRKQMNWVRERNQKLENQQKDMKEVIAQASALRTENFVVYPVNKKDKETNWKKCYNLKAEFVITKNVTAKRGDRVIYLRLKRPDDKVIAFSEKSFFKYQNVSLTYSAKREINYEGDRLEMAIYWPNDGSLVKGKYVAELFSDNELIGSTEFTLN